MELRQRPLSVALGTVPDIAARLLLLLLFTGVLRRLMMTDGATRPGTEQTVVARVVACHTADDRSLQATCCLCRHLGRRDPKSACNQCDYDYPTHDASFRYGRQTSAPSHNAAGARRFDRRRGALRLNVREDQEASRQPE
jgi:hypothetical protein